MRAFVVSGVAIDEVKPTVAVYRDARPGGNFVTTVKVAKPQKPASGAAHVVIPYQGFTLIQDSHAHRLSRDRVAGRPEGVYRGVPLTLLTITDAPRSGLREVIEFRWVSSMSEK